MAKRNKNAKVGYGLDVNEPQDAIHMGEGKRIRLEDIPLESPTGDQQVGNRAYNDARYQLKGSVANNQATFLEGGFWVYTGVGLIFQTVRTVFMMPGTDTPFTVESTLIDLATFPGLNNGTLPQYVRPVWDIAETVVPLFGTASADPGVPSVSDPLTQIAGDEFLLNAGATTVPPGNGEGQVQTKVIFAEGGVGEFSFVHSGAGTANYANAAAPIAGLIDGLVQNVQNLSKETGTDSANFTPTNFETISLDIQLLAVMATGYNLAVQFLDNADAPVSSLVNLPINKGITTIQKVGLAISDFTFSAGLARKAVLQWRRGGGAVTFAGYKFDNFVLQGGLATPIVQGDVELTGHVQGSGQTGEAIEVVITEKAISDQTEQTDPLPSTAQHLVRLADGSLRKVADSLIASGKVDKVTGKSLIDDTEIARLAGINDRFKGKYTSLAALEAAVPTANPGDYAQVDTGASNPVSNYNWDVEDGWVIGSTGVVTISNTDELPEGSTNLYFTAARVRNTILTGISFLTNRAIEATDSILVALGLLQKQITDAIASIAGKQDTLVSGTNIKTVNSNSLLGSGNINVGGLRVYNVEDYGAVHDGTTDDTASIQAAINAAFAAGGGCVYFPKGVYIIGGALQTDVGGINYNSQLYIPQIGFDTNRTTIELVGEFQPNLLRSLGISTQIDPNTGVVLRSTIQGSGVEPAVIKNKGAAANFNGISYTSLQVKNISIQLTPNGSNKITMGGIDCFNSAIANFEYVTCFPFNINLVNSAIPDVIDVTGIAMPKAATEHINTISKCTVGGFTNGYKVGEHGSCYDAIAVCCVNGFLINQNNHLPNLVKVSTFWCVNQITIGTTAPGFPNGGYSFLCTNLGVEWRSAGSWYDTVSTIKDTLNYGRGKMVFDIVEANVGINNEKFKKDGATNVKCEPITIDITSQITATSYTLKYNDGFRKNKVSNAAAQTITIPPNSTTTFDIDQEIVLQRLGAGSVTIVGGAGVTLNIPTGFQAKIKSQYDAVSLVQTAINTWVIYGALEPTP